MKQSLLLYVKVKTSVLSYWEKAVSSPEYIYQTRVENFSTFYFGLFWKWKPVNFLSSLITYKIWNKTLNYSHKNPSITLLMKQERLRRGNAWSKTKIISVFSCLNYFTSLETILYSVINKLGYFDMLFSLEPSLDYFWRIIYEIRLKYRDERMVC